MSIGLYDANGNYTSLAGGGGAFVEQHVKETGNLASAAAITQALSVLGIDSELDLTSERRVSNKAIKQTLDEKSRISKVRLLGTELLGGDVVITADQLAEILNFVAGSANMGAEFQSLNSFRGFLPEEGYSSHYLQFHVPNNFRQYSYSHINEYYINICWGRFKVDQTYQDDSDYWPSIVFPISMEATPVVILTSFARADVTGNDANGGANREHIKLASVSPTYFTYSGPPNELEYYKVENGLTVSYYKQRPYTATYLAISAYSKETELKG